MSLLRCLWSAERLRQSTVTPSGRRADNRFARSLLGKTWLENGYFICFNMKIVIFFSYENGERGYIILVLTGKTAICQYFNGETWYLMWIFNGIYIYIYYIYNQQYVPWSKQGLCSRQRDWSSIGE